MIWSIHYRTVKKRNPTINIIAIQILCIPYKCCGKRAHMMPCSTPRSVNVRHKQLSVKNWTCKKKHLFCLHTFYVRFNRSDDGNFVAKTTCCRFTRVKILVCYFFCFSKMITFEKCVHIFAAKKHRLLVFCCLFLF